MTHALNIVWNPSKELILDFHSLLQPYVCNAFGMVHHENIFEREGESIEN
jgi:hypothetical protein